GHRGSRQCAGNDFYSSQAHTKGFRFGVLASLQRDSAKYQFSWSSTRRPISWVLIYGLNFWSQPPKTFDRGATAQGDSYARSTDLGVPGKGHNSACRTVRVPLSDDYNKAARSFNARETNLQPKGIRSVS